ncbi:MAG: accessory factor UbiK family protein [Tistlia sp.]|uniref:accessory factor UbiK family protein n=1 Tax=Tistlia sp. TaxID=3057121 RepID=UPI0034A13F41
MQTQKPFFDDIARMMSGAAGVASGMREEVEQRFRQMFESTASRMDLVSREEFEAVKAMAAKAREENEALAKRIAALEKAPKAKAATARKGAAKPGNAARSRKTPAAKAAAAKSAAAKSAAAKSAAAKSGAADEPGPKAQPGTSGTGGQG